MPAKSWQRYNLNSTDMAKKAPKKTGLKLAPAAAADEGLDKRERKRNSHFREEISELKGDQLHDAIQWHRMNADLFMRLEIAECLEAGHFTHVHMDNSHSRENGGKGLEIVTLDDDTTVLCFPTDTQYDNWRVLYDQLQGIAPAD